MDRCLATSKPSLFSNSHPRPDQKRARTTDRTRWFSSSNCNRWSVMPKSQCRQRIWIRLESKASSSQARWLSMTPLTTQTLLETKQLIITKPPTNTRLKRFQDLKLNRTSMSSRKRVIILKINNKFWCSQARATWAAASPQVSLPSSQQSKMW